MINNGPVYYPPPSFSITYRSYYHPDNLACNLQQLQGFVYDRDGGSWIQEPLDVRISANIFSATVPISVVAGSSWQIDFPGTASPYAVQLFKRGNILASLAYPLQCNPDCFWNGMIIFFKQDF